MLVDSSSSICVGLRVPEAVTRNPNEHVPFCITIENLNVRNAGHCLRVMVRFQFRLIFVEEITDGAWDSQGTINAVETHIMARSLNS